MAAVLLKALSGCRTGETPGQQDHRDVVVTNSTSYSDYVAGMLLVNDILVALFDTFLKFIFSLNLA